jgi:WD repeat-containing protein 6
VTALKFYRGSSGTLLAGEGSFLKVFEAETSKLLSQCEIFDGQAIHGIAVGYEAIENENELQAVIWGGHCLMLLTKKGLDQLLNGEVNSLVAATISVSDWILDVAITSHDRTSCILVTAHNTVIQARLGQNAEEILLEELPSPSKSILYSAHLIWDTRRRVLVAAGTVFGEIIVWDCDVSEEGTFGESRVLFTFTGHEGSIFGVNISPLIVGPGNFRTRLLASCSDDRTIRIWDLSESLTISTELNILNLPRETGFGENESQERNVISRERCVATIMGHASRIWHVKFLVQRLRSYDSSIVNVLSFGEDSTAQQWALEFDAQLDSSKIKGMNQTINSTDSNLKYEGSLRQINTFAFHSGKHIWSTDLLPPRDPDTNYVLATGGADGKISLYSIEPTGNNTPPENPNETEGISSSKEWDLNDVYACLSSSSLATNIEISNIQVEPLQEDSVPETSTDGKPTKRKKPKKSPKDAFNRYAFVSEEFFIATTTFGRVLLGRIGPSLEWEELELPESGKEDLKSYAVVEGFPELGLVLLASANGKIYSYCLGSNLQEVGSVESKVADMFKIVGGHDNALLATTLASSVATLFTIETTSGGYAGFCNRRLCTLPERFVVTSAGMSDGLLLLGSRNGSLAIYDPEKPDQPLGVWNNEDCTAGDAITTIISLPTIPQEQKTYFLTSGRDGRYSIFTTFNNHQIQPIHHGTPPFGPNIEAAWFTQLNKELILYGFRGKNFIVWNETLQYEISNIECGGAHRSYAYSPLGHFIYTKASKFYIHSQIFSSSHKTIKQGGHGREIKVCAVSPGGKFFATGAEDTAIRIWRYSDSTNSSLENHFECLSVTQKHTAGIQHIKWHGSSYLLSSGGNEEFFVWAITPIPSFGIGVVCEASCPDQSAEKDLRIMSFNVSELSSGLLISLAYSDSTIKTYAYSKTSGFELRAKGRYTSSCLTQIQHLQVSDSRIKLLTAATDGYLTLWESTLTITQLTVLSNKRVHQNAIKTLDISILGSNEDILVATGGDNNALAFTLFSGSSSRTFRFKSAHAAAITGLSFIPRSEDGMLSVVSSGNDQRVKEWSVRVEEGDMEIKKRGDVFTSVADVGDVAFLRSGENSNKVLVVGNGMEVWNVSL